MRNKLINETFDCKRKMQNDENVLRSLNKQRSSRLFLHRILHHDSLTMLLFTTSHDWETVQNVVPGNSSLNADQLGSERKGAEQSSNAYSF